MNLMIHNLVDNDQFCQLHCYAVFILGFKVNCCDSIFPTLNLPLQILKTALNNLRNSIFWDAKSGRSENTTRILNMAEPNSFLNWDIHP